MNKSDLINEISTSTGLSKSAAGKSLDTMLDAISSALKAGDTVQLIGFGTFKVTHRKARIGRNPRTGAEINIPAAKAPVFSAGKALKDTVNK